MSPANHSARRGFEQANEDAVELSDSDEFFHQSSLHRQAALRIDDWRELLGNVREINSEANEIDDFLFSPNSKHEGTQLDLLSN